MAYPVLFSLKKEFQMYKFTVSPEIILAFVAALLALVFDYLPSVAKWYDAKTDSSKKLIMLGLLVLAAGVVFAGSCYGWFVTNLVCEPKSILDLLYGLVLSIATNQGVHSLTKPSDSQKIAMGLPMGLPTDVNKAAGG
jgi:hypothetical protein